MIPISETSPHALEKTVNEGQSELSPQAVEKTVSEVYHQQEEYSWVSPKKTVEKSFKAIIIIRNAPRRATRQ